MVKYNDRGVFVKEIFERFWRDDLRGGRSPASAAISGTRRNEEDRGGLRWRAAASQRAATRRSSRFFWRSSERDRIKAAVGTPLPGSERIQKIYHVGLLIRRQRTERLRGRFGLPVMQGDGGWQVARTAVVQILRLGADTP
jgi:hypothetical protein